MPTATRVTRRCTLWATRWRRRARTIRPAAILKKLLPLPPNDTYARRAVRRLVEIAIETEIIGPSWRTSKRCPPSQPEETRGEIAYLGGRLRQLGGDAERRLHSSIVR